MGPAAGPRRIANGLLEDTLRFSVKELGDVTGRAGKIDREDVDIIAVPTSVIRRRGSAS
jgi:hypothetical protein